MRTRLGCTLTARRAKRGPEQRGGFCAASDVVTSSRMRTALMLSGMVTPSGVEAALARQIMRQPAAPR